MLTARYHHQHSASCSPSTPPSPSTHTLTNTQAHQHTPSPLDTHSPSLANTPRLCAVHSPLRYGQNLGPDNVTLYAEGFIDPLASQLVARYGLDRVRTFSFRVGTEPNTSPGHWGDTVGKYVDMYVAVAAVLRRIVGPNVTVGPGNFCPFYQPGQGCNRTNGGLTTVRSPTTVREQQRVSK